MTELQASLIAIGGAIVAGVISYNKWQEYKARKSVERAFSSAHDDVLMKNSHAAAANDRRVEPVLVDGFDDAVIDTLIPEILSDSASESNADSSGNSSAASEKEIELPIDELIDCAIPLGLENPVRGEKILPVLQTLRHVGSKPVRFVGQRDDGNWEAIAYGGAYSALYAGVQLANRGSALNELEYSELVMRLRQVTDQLGAEPDVPDMSDVMDSARGLHQFVTEYDAQLSVNVLSNGAPWAINTLLAALERQGFDLRPDGRLVMPDGDGGALFSLSTNVTLAAETTSRLTLLLDVPRVLPLRNGFGAMVACAKSLAARLGGTVVDDANQPLTQPALEEIMAQVNTFYADMEAAEIPAGSNRALRLFS
ncbi:MAG: cell division protein [Burkholderiales bacterium RIFCSPLOWO2_02_FULL_57_36]|nr:MAG: cell division protein [Burkholderiales bacterium RIFCSPLOWO2_02_FULL_57_36]